MRTRNGQDGTPERTLASFLTPHLGCPSHRATSRALLALWMDSFPPALQLLSRALPAGLVAPLFPPPAPPAAAPHRKGPKRSEAAVTAAHQPHPPQTQAQSQAQARVELSLSGDWEAFWAAFDKDHFSARLVWTAAARAELAAALEAEERGLRCERGTQSSGLLCWFILAPVAAGWSRE